MEYSIKCFMQTPAVNFPKQSPAAGYPPTTPARKINAQTCTPPIPKWNLFQKAAAAALDAVESALTKYELQHPLPRTVDPRVQISGNFSLVPENPVTHQLSVVGQIPESIRGVYVRNGANPMFEPQAEHHFFDGDDMIQVVKFDHGSASYACWFTENQRLLQEHRLGRPIFPKAIVERETLAKNR